MALARAASILSPSQHLPIPSLQVAGTNRGRGAGALGGSVYSSGPNNCVCLKTEGCLTECSSAIGRHAT